LSSYPPADRTGYCTKKTLATLAKVAELEKGGAAWENQPRVPTSSIDGHRRTRQVGQTEQYGPMPARLRSPTSIAEAAPRWRGL